MGIRCRKTAERMESAFHLFTQLLCTCPAAGSRSIQPSQPAHHVLGPRASCPARPQFQYADSQSGLVHSFAVSMAIRVWHPCVTRTAPAQHQRQSKTRPKESHAQARASMTASDTQAQARTGQHPLRRTALPLKTQPSCASQHMQRGSRALWDGD